ncbi:MAG: hypothetical protein KGI98_08100 [Euryarchaeota archaeon]|nr:hypothetical protein [Euryarchaeota archaeon]
MSFTVKPRQGGYPSPSVLEYYRQQGVLTDPRTQAQLYEGLPQGAPALAGVVQGLLIPPYDRLLQMYGVKEGEFDNARFGVRRAEDFLKRIQKRHPGPLSVPREPKDRIGAICRNFTFLQVSMLHNQGIPSRSRVGFAGYLDDDPAWWCDHRITEYWNAEDSRWVLYDPWVDEIRRRMDGITVDTMNLRPTGKFLLAGGAWQLCRAGKRDPMTFGDSETDRGMPPIRYALLQDLAYLNKIELVGNDDWGVLITKPEAQVTQADKEFLDRIAALTLEPDSHLSEVQAVFSSSDYGATVLDHIRDLESKAT